MNTATLSPAQKAWATRRAQGWTPNGKALPLSIVNAKNYAPAPADIAKPWLDPKPLAAPIDAMDPVTAFEFVEYWVDHPDVGCGFFRFVVLDRGPRKVRLFYCSRLSTIIVNRAEFDRGHMPARKFKRATLADIIRRNRALADKVNDREEREVIPDGGVFTVRALQLVTGESMQ